MTDARPPQPASETETMCIPTEKTDSDSVICAGLAAGNEALDALRAEQQRPQSPDLQQLCDWQMRVVVALQRETGTRFEDVPQHIRDLVQRAETLQQTLRTLIVEWNTRAGLSSIRLQGHTLRDCADGLAAALARVGDLPCSYCQHSHAVHTPVGCVWNCDCAGYERLAPAGPVRQE